jgi:hypothetical protein
MLLKSPLLMAMAILAVNALPQMYVFPDYLLLFTLFWAFTLIPVFPFPAVCTAIPRYPLHIIHYRNFLLDTIWDLFRCIPAAISCPHSISLLFIFISSRDVTLLHTFIASHSEHR